MSTGDSTRFKHGHTSFGKPSTSTYNSWKKMKARCYNQKQYCYDLYGGRGIVTCSRWRDSFVNFLGDMGEKPSRDHSIDRIDGDGNYSCGHCEECVEKGWTANCRWATPQEQMDNSKRSTMLTYEGTTLSIRSWAKKLKVTHAGIRYRLNQGWTICQIVEHFSH